MCPYDCNFAKEAKADQSKTGEDKVVEEKKYICDDPVIQNESNQYRTFQWDAAEKKAKKEENIDDNYCKKYPSNPPLFFEIKEKN